jgi:hypothetical protein
MGIAYVSYPRDSSKNHKPQILVKDEVRVNVLIVPLMLARGNAHESRHSIAIKQLCYHG